MGSVPTLGSRVRAADDVLFQDLHDQGVLLNLKTGVYYGLDPVGTRVWQLLETHATVSDLCQALIAEYDVAEEQCAEDLLALVADLEQHGLVELT